MMESLAFKVTIIALVIIVFIFVGFILLTRFFLNRKFPTIPGAWYFLIIPMLLAISYLLAIVVLKSIVMLNS